MTDSGNTAAAIAANRFGLGARPGDLARVVQDPHGWLAGQLAGAPPLLRDKALQSSREILAKAIELGFKDWAQLRRDTALDPLRLDQRWKDLLKD